MSWLLPLSGRARRIGDEVGTDTILSGARRRETTDPVQLRRYLFEDRDASFAASIREGDILVAGRNFGGGSLTELTVTAFLCTGIRAIVARSFSRPYLRNALNNGLLTVCAVTDDIVEGDPIVLSDVAGGGIELRTPRVRLMCEALPPFAARCWRPAGWCPTCAPTAASGRNSRVKTLSGENAAAWLPVAGENRGARRCNAAAPIVTPPWPDTPT